MKIYRCLTRSILAFALSFNLFGIGFGQSQTNQAIDANTRQEVIEGAIKALNEAYVFPETAKKMEQALRERMQRKEYDNVTDAGEFARLLTAHLQEISKDKHLRVVLGSGSRFGAPPNQQREMAAKLNFGFEKAERLSGNIGYLDLRGFEQATAASETASAAMNFLANTDALIIDLRQNGGGDPAMVAFLTSYLFNQRTHLNSIYSRPANSTRDFFTSEDVPGKKFGDKPVFVLTSSRTFSAAEEFSYNLKSLKRATIVGETTGGGAHPVQPRSLGKLFVITVPFARSINPITKTNWEGTGVKPDVEIAATHALKAAHLLAIRAIQSKINNQNLADQLSVIANRLQGDLDEAKATFTGQAVEYLPAMSSTANAAQQNQPQAQSQTASAEFKYPDTPAGRTLNKFLQALNSGDLAAMKKFHQETGGDPENAEQDLGFYQQSGGLKPHSVVSSSQFEIQILAQGKKDERWLNFSITVESQAPHAVTELRINPTPAPSGEPKTEKQTESSDSKKSETEIIHELSQWIDQQAAADDFSGVVLIAKNGKPIFQKAVGLADKASKTPNRIDTKFNLGSINKLFTRIAITQLIEQGKLSWDDKLGKILPDYPNKEAAEKVTVKRLVEMQSGIGDFFGKKYDATPKERLRSINDYLPLFADQALAFEPGSKRAYSNGGYIVLGAIIEKVTGQTYYDYVREHIFKPAGMANTDSYFSDSKTLNLAEGYRRNEKGERVNNVDTRPARGSSAGGGYSTTEDLLKFSIALLGNKLLSAEATRKIVGGGIGVAGGAPGINSELEIEPRSGYTIIVMGNYDPPNAANVNRRIRQLLGMKGD
ncbi:MAG: serine hydrolase [Blastocatellales bacterium]